MAAPGRAWLCLAALGCAWPNLAALGYALPRRALVRMAMLRMAAPDCAWVRLAAHGCAWPHMAVLRCAWPCLAARGCAWLCVSVPHCRRTPRQLPTRRCGHSEAHSVCARPGAARFFFCMSPLTVPSYECVCVCCFSERVARCRVFGQGWQGKSCWCVRWPGVRLASVRCQQCSCEFLCAPLAPYPPRRQCFRALCPCRVALVGYW